MNKAYLLKSATSIKRATPEARAEFGGQRDHLVALLDRRMLDRPDTPDLVGGKANLDLMRDNHRNHARFVESMLAAFHPDVLVETVLWAFRTYRSRGFHVAYWAAQLDEWVEILRRELTPETFAAVYPLYEWMIIHLPIFSKLSDEALEVGVETDG